MIAVVIPSADVEAAIAAGADTLPAMAARLGLDPRDLLGVLIQMEQLGWIDSRHDSNLRRYQVLGRQVVA